MLQYLVHIILENTIGTGAGFITFGNLLELSTLGGDASTCGEGTYSGGREQGSLL